jgi:hypothetical protein
MQPAWPSLPSSQFLEFSSHLAESNRIKQFFYRFLGGFSSFIFDFLVFFESFFYFFLKVFFCGFVRVFRNSVI